MKPDTARHSEYQLSVSIVGVTLSGGTPMCRQCGRWSFQGPYPFRLSCSLVGSNARAIVSLCLARKYIYGQEICRLTMGPMSLDERVFC